MSNDHQDFNQQQDAFEKPKSKRNCCLLAAGGCGCLAVVVVIVAVVAGIYAFRSMGGLMGGTVNAIAIGQALEKYSEVHGSYPPAYTVDENGKPLHSWRVLILPYLSATTESPFGEDFKETQDLKALYESIRLDEPWDSEHNQQFASKMPRCYFNGTLKEEGKTNFQMIIGPKCISDGPNARTVDEIRRFRRVVIVEANPSVEWMKPQDIQYTDVEANRFVDGETSGVTCPHSFATMQFGVAIIGGNGDPEIYFNEEKFASGQRVDNNLTIEQIRERAVFENEIGENVPELNSQNTEPEGEDVDGDQEEG